MVSSLWTCLYFCRFAKFKFSYSIGLEKVFKTKKNLKKWINGYFENNRIQYLSIQLTSWTYPLKPIQGNTTNTSNI